MKSAARTASQAITGRLLRRLPVTRSWHQRLMRLQEQNQRTRDRLQIAQERNQQLKAANRALRDDLSRSAGRRSKDLGYVFVVTYGRSGSTLLQGILNSLPGYLIRGENGDALHSLFLYHHKLSVESRQQSRSRQLTTRDAWFGIDQYDRSAAVAGIRELVVSTLLRPTADTRVTGFKEIRWWHRDWTDYFDFLLEIFPGARFIINTRSHEAVMRSKWYADTPDAGRKLTQFERRLDQVQARLTDSAFRVHYDDYVHDPAALRPLLSWLDAPFDHEAIARVLAVKHSS